MVLCFPEREALQKVERLVSRKLKEPEKKRVLFFQPEELFFFLEREVASLAGREERISGYKVKVNFQPVAEGEKAARREAAGQVILHALRRMKTEG